MATMKLRPRGLVRRGAVALTAVLALGALAACSAGTDSGNGGTPTGKLQILVSSADASDSAFKAVNAGFEKKYPKVDVVFSSVPNGNFPATKSSRLTANNVDIAVVRVKPTPSFAKDSTPDDVRLAESGGLLDLTSQPFMKKYEKSVLDVTAIGGKQYAVPTGLSYSTGIYYNKALFAKNGLSVPTTWSELKTAMSTLKSAGVTPFGIAGKDTWPAGLLMLGSVGSAYPTAEAKDGLAADIWKNKTKLDDQKLTGILDQTETVFENAQTDFAGAGYDQMPAAFAAGSFAMMADGTWNQPTIDTAVAGKFDYGYFPFPGSDDAADNKYLNGKIELQLAVPAGTKNKTAALAWLDYFSQADTYKSFVSRSGFSSAESGVDTSAFLSSIGDYTSTFQPAWDFQWIPSSKAGQAAIYPFNYPALSPLGTDSAGQASAAAAQAWKS